MIVSTDIGKFDEVCHPSHLFIIDIKLFWDMTPCWLVNSYRHFGGPWCLHLHCLSNPRRVAMLEKSLYYVGMDDCGCKPMLMVCMLPLVKSTVSWSIYFIS
jgi:hypothetical protein